MALRTIIPLHVLLMTAGSFPSLQAVAVIAQIALGLHQTDRLLGMAVDAVPDLVTMLIMHCFPRQIIR